MTKISVCTPQKTNHETSLTRHAKMLEILTFVRNVNTHLKQQIIIEAQDHCKLHNSSINICSLFSEQQY